MTSSKKRSKKWYAFEETHFKLYRERGVKTAHEDVKSSKVCFKIIEEVRNKLGDGNQKCISDVRRVV